MVLFLNISISSLRNILKNSKTPCDNDSVTGTFEVNFETDETIRDPKHQLKSLLHLLTVHGINIRNGFIALVKRIDQFSKQTRSGRFSDLLIDVSI